MKGHHPLDEGMFVCANWAKSWGVCSTEMKVTRGETGNQHVPTSCQQVKLHCLFSFILQPQFLGCRVYQKVFLRNRSYFFIGYQCSINTWCIIKQQQSLVSLLQHFVIANYWVNLLRKSQYVKKTCENNMQASHFGAHTIHYEIFLHIHRTSQLKQRKLC